ncbi:hypothetical protein LCX93_11460 [Sulfurimonas sp. SWIR-19]|uniref:hypothetical protein n=1 Tax=Sulfurimonas sp. SWIR-19 TaxID=2878390 RepID=UPI001CF3ECAA|nr:hypothetical protein [Sulfurimonas sp. SWIR-19]UCN00128.1 hypothetical protein LCX93_11460 [Sulfurimonas sp. SWIR-19]
MVVKYEDLDSIKVKDMIKRHESFEIVGLSGRMGSAVSKIENIIETANLSCRIYTYGRIASAGAALAGGITGLAGVGAAIGMAAHNIATYDPDYEIAKHIVDNKLSVTYKK